MMSQPQHAVPCPGDPGTPIFRRESLDHWDTYWKRRPISQVYDNAGRLSACVREVLGNDLTGLMVLEVGAGSGRDSVELADRGARAVILDTSTAALRLTAFAGTSHASPLRVKADAFRLPFAENSFDLVFHQGLLEHYRNPERLIAENIRGLKPGGHLLIEVPQRWHIYTAFKHILIFLGRWFAGWETEFSMSELRTLFHVHGIRPVAFYGEWFHPSLGYRIVREALWRIGIHLPLVPFQLPGLSWLRAWFRQRMRSTWVAARFGAVIGLLGQKGMESAPVPVLPKKSSPPCASPS